MSQENVEMLRRGYEAYNRGDAEGTVADFAPTFEYHDTPEFPDGGMHLGREAFRRHVESYLDAWSDASVEVDARAVGEQVVGRIRYTGAGRATGIEVETPEYGALYDFRAGRIRRVRQFATYADALEAAGLSE
jgi:ketosteroid isomerase-like protein